MRFWLITVGEPLPLPGCRDRLWRTGLLAEHLVRRGHDVVWWTSTVDHFRKTILVQGEPKVLAENGVWIRFLSGRLYRRNISFRRLLNHRQIAQRFVALSSLDTRPDGILCSFPTVELSREAVRYGLQNGVPVILDVRDLWPDVILKVIPAWAQVFGRLLLRKLFNDASRALEACTAMFAVSEGYLNWGLMRGNRDKSSNDRVYPLGYPIVDWSKTDEVALKKRLQRCGVESSMPLAIFVGTFGRTYDLRTVIEAAKLISKRGNCRVQFVLCGAGEREEEWQKYASKVSNIAFVGWLPAGELACLLSRSTIGLAAYARGAPQGIPNKVIEYLAAGLPVLCSLEGESRQLLESLQCGTYYPADDSQLLAKGIEQIICDEALRKSMSEAAREVFSSRFSAASVYDELADQLERIIESEQQNASGRPHRVEIS